MVFISFLLHSSLVSHISPQTRLIFELGEPINTQNALYNPYFNYKKTSLKNRKSNKEHLEMR